MRTNRKMNPVASVRSIVAGAVLGVIIAGAAAGCASGDAYGSGATTRSARINYSRGRLIATLGDKRITESSGLAYGWLNKGVFWTHNDSGHGARIYAFNMKGQPLAVCDISGASMNDWEDMCSFVAGDRSVLLIGDTGDNSEKLAHYTLYAVYEPRLDLERRNVSLTLKVAQTINYRYSDGPANCESIAVDPTTRTIYIVTKARTLGKSCKVYALPWPKKPSRKIITLKPIATVKNGITTAMDISPDGRRAVVLTYLDAREYTRIGDETWAQAFSRGGGHLAMPHRKQGESICYGPDGKTLYLTSEKVPTPLLEVAPVRPVKAGKKQGRAPRKE